MVQCYGFEDPTRRRLETTLTPLTVNITTDGGGQDTSFRITKLTGKDLGDEEILAGCPQGKFDDDTEYSYTLENLDPGDCFEVTVWDCTGDGMCNDYGCSGSWSVEFGDQTKTSDGNFGEQEDIQIGTCPTNPTFSSSF